MKKETKTTDKKSNPINGFFKIEERGSSIKKELIAGLIIFLAMFYIVPVQGGMIGGVTDPSLIPTIGIVTALTAALASIMMGLYSNHPTALASGMGVNAFVAFTLILGGGMSFDAAMSAVLISGLIFIAISVTPARTRILNSIPDQIKKSISIGVGLFLLFVAFVNSGIISNLTPMDGVPTGLGDLSDPVIVLSLLCVFITIILWVLNIEGAVIIGMIATIVIGLIFNYGGSAIGWTTNGLLPSFDSGAYENYGAAFTNLPQVIGSPFRGVTEVKSTWADPTWYLAIFVLFLNDFFDTAGTLFGVNSHMEKNGIALDEKTNNKVLIVDAIGTTVGSMFGSTNVTIFAESTSGVIYGGRTGLTSITTGVLFLLSIPVIPLLSPLLTSSVTVGAIVLVGIMMSSLIKEIDTDDKVYLASSILTIMFMILGYSIGTGIVIGLLTFIILMLVSGRYKEMDWILIASSPMFLAFLILPILF